jgi:hypothetical protein
MACAPALFSAALLLAVTAVCGQELRGSAETAPAAVIQLASTETAPTTGQAILAFCCAFLFPIACLRAMMKTKPPAGGSWGPCLFVSGFILIVWVYTMILAWGIKPETILDMLK